MSERPDRSGLSILENRSFAESEGHGIGVDISWRDHDGQLDESAGGPQKKAPATFGLWERSQDASNG